MCKATEDMRSEAVFSDRVQSALDMLKDEGLSDEEIVKRVANKYNVSEEYVRSLLNTAA